MTVRHVVACYGPSVLLLFVKYVFFKLVSVLDRNVGTNCRESVGSESLDLVTLSGVSILGD